MSAPIRRAPGLVDLPVRLLALALAFVLALALAACSSHTAAPQPGSAAAAAAPDVPIGILPTGEAVRVELDGEKIGRLVPASAQPTTWLWPPIVDSHVHLTYWPVADRLAASGIAA